MMLRRFAVNVVLFALVAVAVGWGSATYMVDNGSRLSVKWSGPWKLWTMLGRPDADPYAKAFMVRKGLLPIASTTELTYIADTDSAGGWLNSACEYRLVVDGFNGAWWSVAAYSNKGVLVPNAADRYAFNASTAMHETDGRSVITLARDARPGNWLPIGGGTQINVVLAVQTTPDLEKGGQRPLPEIERLSCR